VGVGLYARLVAVFCVDEVHCLALPRRWEKLPITGSRFPYTPEFGHWQVGLRINHHGQGAGHSLAFDMPP